MLKVDSNLIENLGFDLNEALESFRQEKAEHILTVNVPAPTAHPLVEAAYAAGGFEIIVFPAEEEAPSAPPEIQVSPLIEEIRRSLEAMEKRPLNEQVEEIRRLLLMLFGGNP